MAGFLRRTLAQAMATRTQVRRLPKRGAYDRATIDAILDEGLVCHVGIVQDGQPFVMPTGYVRDGDRILLHGSTASRLMRALAAGEPACVTVTLLDGVVMARSAFHHSMNYRSVVLLGRAAPIVGETERRAALRTYMERLAPGRWDECRQPNAQEEAGTLVVEMPILEASAKVRAGPPGDEPEDFGHPAWSGVVPLRLMAGAPEQDPTQSGPERRPPPPHVASWRPEARAGR